MDLEPHRLADSDGHGVDAPRGGQPVEEVQSPPVLEVFGRGWRRPRWLGVVVDDLDAKPVRRSVQLNHDGCAASRGPGRWAGMNDRVAHELAREQFCGHDQVLGKPVAELDYALARQVRRNLRGREMQPLMDPVCPCPRLHH